jgi:ubiquinone/menaquinone biosynthesis C-methylase UbiE
MTQLSDNVPHVLRSQYASDENLAKRLNLHEAYSTNQQPWQHWVYEQLSLRAGERILELGCGMGQLWGRNGDRIPPNASFVLTDFSAGMLESTRGAIGGLIRDAEFVVMDAQEIQSDDCAFDLVVANHVLYHVPDRRKALREIQRVLKIGGRAVMTANGPTHMRQLDDLLERCFPQVKRDDSAQKFGLETAPAQVRSVFGEVEVRRYPDALLVTDPEAIVQYAVSTLQADEVSAPGLNLLRQLLAEALERDGVFHADKDGGALLACKTA